MVPDKVHAIAGLEYKLQLLTIKGSNPDMERHFLEFESMIDCHAFGRKHMGRQTF